MAGFDDPVWRMFGPAFQQGVADRLDKTGDVLIEALPKIQKIGEEAKSLSRFFLFGSAKGLAFKALKSGMDNGRERQEVLNKRSPRKE